MFILFAGSTVWFVLSSESLRRQAHVEALVAARTQALEESERSKSVLLENLPGMAYRCRYDEHWTMEFISEGCAELTDTQTPISSATPVRPSTISSCPSTAP